MSRSSMQGLLLVTCAAGALVSACTDEAPKRLSDALAQVGIKDVVVGEQKIEATCAQGDKIEVPTAELDRNFLGMSNPKKVVLIAKNMAKDCEEKDGAKKREEAQKVRLTDTLKALAIDATGMDDATVRKTICAKLTERLPRKEPDRTQEAAKNMREWSCEAAPPLAALPGGLWEVTLGKAQGKKPAMHFARLANEDQDRLTLRCTVAKAPKPEVYVQLAEKTKVKKGTKFVMVSLDGKKPEKWKANVAKDLSAIFFDAKVALKPLAAAQKLSVEVPTAKKAARVAFELKGFADAIKPFPAGCN